MEVEVETFRNDDFITINSSLVPFTEGQYSSHPYGFECFALHSHLWLFSLEIYVKTKNQSLWQLVQDLVLPLSIYTHMSTLYTYTNTYMPRSIPCNNSIIP